MDPGVRLELTTSRVWTSPATIANTLESRTGKRFQNTLQYAVVSFQQQRQPLITLHIVGVIRYNLNTYF